MANDWNLKTDNDFLTNDLARVIWNRNWTGIWTMRLDSWLNSRAIFAFFIACLLISVAYFVNFVQHTVFSSYTSMYIVACKYVWFTHVYTFDHSISLYSGHITLKLSDLPGCKTVECICGLVRVYLSCLIIYFTGSLILYLPVFALHYNIPESFVFDIFYTRLVIIGYFSKRCRSVLRIDLSAIRPLYDFETRLSAILILTCSAFARLCISIYSDLWKLTSSIFAQIFNNLHVWLFFCNLPVRPFHSFAPLLFWSPYTFP